MLNLLVKTLLFPDYVEEDKPAGETFLVSEEDSEDFSLFIPPGHTLGYPCQSATKDAIEAAQPNHSAYMLDVCKHSTESLGIPWGINCPSQADGKATPNPELQTPTPQGSYSVLEENLYSSKPLFKEHPLWILKVWKITPWLICHPWSHWWQNTKMPATSSRLPSHPAKADRFQSAIMEWAYKVEALAV